MITLTIVQGSAEGTVLELDQPTVTLGRAETNTVVLTDYHLSGEHGQIFCEADQYIYRDLRSTNGSILERKNKQICVDSASSYEITLRDGDRLSLGDPREPVVIEIALANGDAPGDDLGERFIASRSIVDLPKVTDEVEHDPQTAVRLYKALSPLSSRLDMSEVLDAIIDAAFDLLERSTNVSILLRSEVDEDRFTVALARLRGGRGSRPNTEVGTETVRASRSILKRVLSENAAVLTANAQQDMPGSESILSGKIFSVLAVPLWRGEQIIGLIQVDNRSGSGMFDERDLDVALILGGQATLAVDNASLVSRLKIAQEQLKGENVYLKKREQNRRFDNIIGEAQVMKDVISQLKKVIDTRATVCIEGETGTGKELIASAVHYQSRRAEKMFVAQNCAALPENLLESELFGHCKGAFTSADSDKKGLFEIADNGTLFLDEIGEMPMSLQAKLLRTLQEGTIRPVGATLEKSIDVRIICATNRELDAEVKKGAFREDLYYRLMVFPIRLPPLRERREDIPLLADHFMKRYSEEYRRVVSGFAQETLDALCAYHWPGNIRELENEIQRLIIQADNNSWLEVDHLSPQIRKVEGTIARIAPKKGTLKQMMEQLERWLLAEALRDHDNNKTKTAKTLGITREGLHKKLSKFGM